MIKYFVILASVLLLHSCSTNNEEVSLQPASLNFSPLFNFTTDSLNLDITSSLANNSIYISYSDDAAIYSEKVLRYNLSNSQQTDLTHYDASDGVQIEVVGDNIFSLSYNNTTKYDLNLSGSTQLSYSSLKAKAAKNGSDILLFSAEDYAEPILPNMIVQRYNTLSDSYSEIAVYPNGNRFAGDGVVYGTKLYIFGGNDGAVNYPEILVYDLTTDVWSQEALPFPVYESFAALYNGSVVVAGNKNSDSGEAFIGIFDFATNTFSELPTTLNLADKSIRGIAVVNDDVYLIYTNYSSPFGSSLVMTVAKASLQ